MQSDSRFTALLTVRVPQDNIPAYLNLMAAHFQRTEETEPETTIFEHFDFDGGDGLFYYLESFSSSEAYVAHVENQLPEVVRKMMELGVVIEDAQVFGNPEGKAKELVEASPLPTTINRRICGYARN